MYSSLSDLNLTKNEDIKKERSENFKINKPYELIEEYAFAVIAFSPVFVFSKNFKVLRLNIENPYSEQGIPSDIEDILPFDEL